MAYIFGELGLADNERVFQATVGQSVVYEIATEWVAARNAELAGVVALFVGETTSDHKRRYKLPGGGFMQRRARGGRPGMTKAFGSWDVALPLEDFADGIAGDDVSMAYMTVADLELHISNIVARNTNTVRHEILGALLRNTQWAFADELWGTLNVEPLANGDTVKYPPILGAVAEDIENHFLAPGIALSAIDDTHNPFELIANDLQEHFGASTGNDNIMAFFGQAVTAKVRTLAEFVSMTDAGINPGDDTDVLLGIPGHPGRIIGRLEESGVWLCEWRFIPDNYVYGQALYAAPPLGQRVDPADTGLGQGLQLVSEDDEFPFTESFWRNRTGYGALNRLNGVSVFLDAATTYAIPPGYEK